LCVSGSALAMAEKRYAPDNGEGGPSKDEEEKAKPWAPFCLALAPLTAKVRTLMSRGQSDRVEPFDAGQQQPSPTEEGEKPRKSNSQFEMYMQLLSGHQQHEIREAFDKFDRDGSGFIDAQELHATMRMMGSTATKEQVKAMIASVDDDGNGTVEFEEFLVIMARRILMHEGAMELEAAIKLFEVDMRGRIECSQIRTLLCTLGEAPLSDDELDELLRLADPEGTGFCTLEHFRDLPCWKLPINDTEEKLPDR